MSRYGSLININPSIKNAAMKVDAKVCKLHSTDGESRIGLCYVNVLTYILYLIVEFNDCEDFANCYLKITSLANLVIHQTPCSVVR